MLAARHCRSLYCILACSACSAFVPPLARHHVRASSSIMASAAADASSSTITDFTKDLPTPLILGSGSFTRKLILGEMGIDYKVIKRPIDEYGIGNRDEDAPADLVLTLAKAKAAHLVKELEAGNCQQELQDQELPFVVLTGDQVVTIMKQQNDTTTNTVMIMEKPDSIQQAKDFLQRYAESPPSTVGSCVLTHVPSGIQVSGVDTATIHFAPSIAEQNQDGKDLVDRLLEQDAPILDCAGGLMVEHDLVQEHLVRIDGTQDSVMGLSKALVERLLDELRSKLKE